jgi:hypothetical protein
VKLLIFFSKHKIITSIPRNSELITLYQSERLLIQGGGDAVTLDLKNERKAFLFGDILGCRTRQGDIRPLSGLEDLKELIENVTIEQCRDTLEGRFILVVAGPGDQCSVCTDRYGKRDLYYCLSDETKCIASDLSLFPDSPAKGGYDQVALMHALCMYGYRSPKRHTPYRGVRRLGVLETAHINSGEILFETEEFKPIPTERFGDREMNEYADIFLDSLRIGGSRYGNVVYLSSGWDSSSILAGLVHLFGRRKVRCVIGCMKYAERSGVINPFEIARAKAVADYYDVRLDIVDFDYRGKSALELHDRLKPLMQLPHHTSGGAGFNHAILADYVARTTNGDESVFAGEISDGAHNLGFSQFLTIFHPVQEFREYSDKMGSYLFSPTFFTLFQEGKHLEDPIYNLFRSRSGDSLFDQRNADNSEKRIQQLLSSFFLRPNRIPLWSLNNIKMLTKAGAEIYEREMESAYFNRAAVKVIGDTLYSWYLHLYNSFHWQCSTIAPLGITSEIYGIKMVLPFWDSRIQEFLSAMPENWGRGLDLNPTKYPLKWMLKNRIDYPMHLNTGPHSYQYDVNPNFNLGAEMIYGSGFAPRFKESLKKKAYRDVFSPEVINIPYIDGIVDRYLNGSEVYGSELRDLLSLCWLSLAGWYGAE